MVEWVDWWMGNVERSHQVSSATTERCHNVCKGVCVCGCECVSMRLCVSARATRKVCS